MCRSVFAWAQGSGWIQSPEVRRWFWPIFVAAAIVFAAKLRACALSPSFSGLILKPRANVHTTWWCAAGWSDAIVAGLDGAAVRAANRRKGRINMALSSEVDTLSVFSTQIRNALNADIVVHNGTGRGHGRSDALRLLHLLGEWRTRKDVFFVSVNLPKMRSLRYDGMTCSVFDATEADVERRQVRERLASERGTPSASDLSIEVLCGSVEELLDSARFCSFKTVTCVDSFYYYVDSAHAHVASHNCVWRMHVWVSDPQGCGGVLEEEFSIATTFSEDGWPVWTVRELAPKDAAAPAVYKHPAIVLPAEVIAGRVRCMKYVRSVRGKVQAFQVVVRACTGHRAVMELSAADAVNLADTAAYCPFHPQRTEEAYDVLEVALPLVEDYSTDLGLALYGSKGFAAWTPCTVYSDSRPHSLALWEHFPSDRGDGLHARNTHRGRLGCPVDGCATVAVGRDIVRLAFTEEPRIPALLKSGSCSDPYVLITCRPLLEDDAAMLGAPYVQALGGGYLLYTDVAAVAEGLKARSPGARHTASLLHWSVKLPSAKRGGPRVEAALLCSAVREAKVIWVEASVIHDGKRLRGCVAGPLRGLSERCRLMVYTVGLSDVERATVSSSIDMFDGRVERIVHATKTSSQELCQEGDPCVYYLNRLVRATCWCASSLDLSFVTETFAGGSYAGAIHRDDSKAWSTDPSRSWSCNNPEAAHHPEACAQQHDPGVESECSDPEVVEEVLSEWVVMHITKKGEGKYGLPYYLASEEIDKPVGVHTAVYVPFKVPGWAEVECLKAGDAVEVRWKHCTLTLRDGTTIRTRRASEVRAAGVSSGYRSRAARCSSVSVIIATTGHDGQLLFMMHRRSKRLSGGGFYAHICGHLEGSEDPIEGALREIREEAGWSFSPEDLHVRSAGQHTECIVWLQRAVHDAEPWPSCAWELEKVDGAWYEWVNAEFVASSQVWQQQRRTVGSLPKYEAVLPWHLRPGYSCVSLDFNGVVAVDGNPGVDGKAAVQAAKGATCCFVLSRLNDFKSRRAERVRSTCAELGIDAYLCKHATPSDGPDNKLAWLRALRATIHYDDRADIIASCKDTGIEGVLVSRRDGVGTKRAELAYSILNHISSATANSAHCASMAPASEPCLKRELSTLPEPAYVDLSDSRADYSAVEAVEHEGKSSSSARGDDLMIESPDLTKDHEDTWAAWGGYGSTAGTWWAAAGTPWTAGDWIDSSWHQDSATGEGALCDSEEADGIGEGEAAGDGEGTGGPPGEDEPRSRTPQGSGDAAPIAEDRASFSEGDLPAVEHAGGNELPDQDDEAKSGEGHSSASGAQVHGSGEGEDDFERCFPEAVETCTLMLGGSGCTGSLTEVSVRCRADLLAAALQQIGTPVLCDEPQWRAVVTFTQWYAANVPLPRDIIELIAKFRGVAPSGLKLVSTSPVSKPQLYWRVVDDTRTYESARLCLRDRAGAEARDTVAVTGCSCDVCTAVRGTTLDWRREAREWPAYVASAAPIADDVPEFVSKVLGKDGETERRRYLGLLPEGVGRFTMPRAREYAANQEVAGFLGSERLLIDPRETKDGPYAGFLDFDRLNCCQAIDEIDDYDRQGMTEERYVDQLRDVDRKAIRVDEGFAHAVLASMPLLLQCAQDSADRVLEEALDVCEGFPIKQADLVKGGGYEVAVSNDMRGKSGWKNEHSKDVIESAAATFERWANECSDAEIPDLARFIFGSRGPSFAMGLPREPFVVKARRRYGAGAVPNWRFFKHGSRTRLDRRFEKRYVAGRMTRVEVKAPRARLVTGEAKAVSLWMGHGAYHELRRALTKSAWRTLGRRPLLKRDTRSVEAAHHEVGLPLPSTISPLSVKGPEAHGGLGCSATDGHQWDLTGDVSGCDMSYIGEIAVDDDSDLFAPIGGWPGIVTSLSELGRIYTYEVVRRLGSFAPSLIIAHARGVAKNLAAPSLHPPFRQIQELAYQLSAMRRLEIWPGGIAVAITLQWAPSGIQKIQDVHNARQLVVSVIIAAALAPSSSESACPKRARPRLDLEPIAAKLKAASDPASALAAHLRSFGLIRLFSSDDNWLGLVRSEARGSLYGLCLEEVARADGRSVFQLLSPIYSALYMKGGFLIRYTVPIAFHDANDLLCVRYVVAEDIGAAPGSGAVLDSACRSRNEVFPRNVFNDRRKMKKKGEQLLVGAGVNIGNLCALPGDRLMCLLSERFCRYAINKRGLLLQDVVVEKAGGVFDGIDDADRRRLQGIINEGSLDRLIAYLRTSLMPGALPQEQEALWIKRACEWGPAPLNIEEGDLPAEGLQFAGCAAEIESATEGSSSDSDSEGESCSDEEAERLAHHPTPVLRARGSKALPSLDYSDVQDTVQLQRGDPHLSAPGFKSRTLRALIGMIKPFIAEAEHIGTRFASGNFDLDGARAEVHAWRLKWASVERICTVLDVGWPLVGVSVDAPSDPEHAELRDEVAELAHRAIEVRYTCSIVLPGRRRRGLRNPTHGPHSALKGRDLAKSHASRWHTSREPGNALTCTLCSERQSNSESGAWEMPYTNKVFLAEGACRWVQDALDADPRVRAVVVTYLPDTMTPEEVARISSLKVDARVFLILGDVVEVLGPSGVIDTDGLSRLLALPENGHILADAAEIAARMAHPEHVSFDGVAVDAFGKLSEDWVERSASLAMRAFRYAVRSGAHTLQVKIAGGSVAWMSEPFTPLGDYRLCPFQGPAAKHSEDEFYIIGHRVRPGKDRGDRWFSQAFMNSVLRLYLARCVNGVCLARTWMYCYFGQCGRLPPTPAKDDPELAAFRHHGAFVVARDHSLIGLATIFLPPSHQVLITGSDYTTLRSMTLGAAFSLHADLSEEAIATRTPPVRSVWIDGQGIGLLGLMLARMNLSVGGCDVDEENVSAVQANGAACGTDLNCLLLNAFSEEAARAAQEYNAVILDPLWAPQSDSSKQFTYASRDLHDLAAARARSCGLAYVRGPYSTDRSKRSGDATRPRFGPFGGEQELIDFYRGRGVKARFVGASLEAALRETRPTAWLRLDACNGS